MSFIQSNIHNSILAMDHPLKIFVKESNVCEESPVKKVKSGNLGFKGLEAKIAYEETIKESSHNNKKQEVIAKVISQRSRAKQRIQKNQKNVVQNVTVNLIFKAIEEKDMTFLETNLHSGNVNIFDGYGWTPLMSAAYAGNLDIVEFLLKLGANKKIRDKSGLTASQLASKKHFTQIEEILEKGGNIRRLRNSTESSRKDSLGNSATVVDKQVPETTAEKESNKRNNFYCSICDFEFKDTTIKQHESSIVHMFNTKPKVLNAHYMIPKGSKGYQMLINSGWNEEHGLGPFGEGRKYPVKTTLKQDRKGLGLDQKNIPRVTHFQSGDRKAVKTTRVFNQRTLKKKDRERQLSKEAKREKAIRKALS